MRAASGYPVVYFVDFDLQALLEIVQGHFGPFGSKSKVEVLLVVAG